MPADEDHPVNHWSVCSMGSALKSTAYRLGAALALTFWFFQAAQAYEHDDSLVDFLEFDEGVVAANREGKPYFLLFSAQWCHWCHEFSAHTLTREDVADYLNRNFTNIFIDVDIHHAAYVKYRATGVPYIVFLNPDGSVYYKYTGTLYGDDFLDVIRQVAGNAGAGKSAYGEEYTQIKYTPPDALAESDLIDMPNTFRRGVMENFDSEEYGLGKDQKTILPLTFLYLMEEAEGVDRKDVIESITLTLERAIKTIYDPIEGGFFRYAETRDWRVPHYEKFADLNAGVVLLLYKLNHMQPSPGLKQAADRTLDYLTTTLFDEDAGAFLSFQVADTAYYLLSEEGRQAAGEPRVMEKIFADRLAATLGYLIEVLDYTDSARLRNKVTQSLQFLGEMVIRDEGLNRYYQVSQQEWRGRGGLPDYAYNGLLFARAGRRLEDPYYINVAIKLISGAIAEFYDEKLGVFLDPTVDSAQSAEYLMQLNGMLALAMMELSPEQDTHVLVRSVLKYFSLMGEVLEDRLWDGVEWEFTENYVPYLIAVEAFLATRPASR